MHAPKPVLPQQVTSSPFAEGVIAIASAAAAAAVVRLGAGRTQHADFAGIAGVWGSRCAGWA